MPLLAPAGYLYWYTTSVILFILTLFNIIFKVYNHYSIISRPTELTALPISRRTLKSSHSDPTASSLYAKSRVEEATCYDQRRSIPYRLARVVITGYNRYFGLTSVTLPGICVCSTKKWIGISSEELAWTVGYAVGVMLLSFWGCELSSSTHSVGLTRRAKQIADKTSSFIPSWDLLKSSCVDCCGSDSSHHSLSREEQLGIMYVYMVLTPVIALADEPTHCRAYWDLLRET